MSGRRSLGIFCVVPGSRPGEALLLGSLSDPLLLGALSHAETPTSFLRCMVAARGSIITKLFVKLILYHVLPLMMSTS